MKEHRTALGALVIVALAGLGTVALSAYALDRRTRRLFGPPFRPYDEYRYVLAPDPVLASAGMPVAPATDPDAHRNASAPKLSDALRRNGRAKGKKRD